MKPYSAVRLYRGELLQTSVKIAESFPQVIDVFPLKAFYDSSMTL
jgi:hypothetical protein